MTERTAAAAVADALLGQQVDRVFCVPGESYLAVLDALSDRCGIEVITCRHESGAGFAAVADAKLTGRVGVAMVSRGPGATNASIAVHTAEQDAVPLVLVVGQVERKDLGRGAFQEVDYGAFFGGMAKGIWQIHDADMVPETVSRAFAVAAGGTPGPVIVVLPEDMLLDSCMAPDLEPQATVRAGPEADDIETVCEMLGQAERPLLLVGSGARTPEAIAALSACSESWEIPVGTTFKNQDLIDNENPCFAGHFGYGLPREILDRAMTSDLVLAVGTRLGDVSTQNYVFPRAPIPEQTLVHVHPDPGVIGRVHNPTLGIVCDAGKFLGALAQRNPPPVTPAKRDWRDSLHGDYARMREWMPVEAKDGVVFGAVCAALDTAIGERCVITMDGGNFGGWMHRYFRFAPERMLMSAATGAMGIGMPGALAAALRWRDRPVVSIIGDGGFLMTGNELATAVQFNAPLKAFVSNNGSFGTIRLHQEKAFPGRVMATDLQNPDFAAMAESFGAAGFALDSADNVEKIVAEALAVDGPAVVDVRTSLEHISAFTTLSALAV